MSSTQSSDAFWGRDWWNGSDLLVCRSSTKRLVARQRWKSSSAREDLELVAALLELLTGGDFAIAIAAAWEFHWHRELASPELRRRLLALLSSVLHQVRTCAALVFGQLGPAIESPEVTRDLLRLVKEDEHEEVRAAAAGSLGSIGSADPTVGDALFGALHDSSPLVRIFAIRGMGELCSEGCESEVIERLSSVMVHDSDGRVRATADELCVRLLDRISMEDELCEEQGESPTCGKPRIVVRWNGNDAAPAVDSRPDANPTPLVLWNDAPLDHAHIGLVLRRLRNLVRIGMRAPSSAEKWQQLVSENLLTLKELKEARFLTAEVDALDLAILEAEFEDRCGRYENAVRALEDTIPALMRDDADALLTQEIPTVNELPALRLKVWVWMTYAWVRYYRFGEYDAAKSRLESVATRIHAMRDSDNPWYGTLSRLEYYRGHCLRGMRSFKGAESCFTEAAALADKRREFRLAHGGKRAFECLWAVVTTARVQGAGLGWSLLQRGRLIEAKRHLRFAQNVLNTTGEEFTKLFNRSLLLIVDRRLTPTYDSNYRSTLDQLHECAWEYARLKDTTGQLRCFHELCLGFLDLCEFQEDMSCRQEAKDMLTRIASLRRQTQDKRWHLRYDLLCARHELTPLGEIPGRRAIVPPERLRELVQTIGRHLAKDPSNGKLLIMRGLLLWVEGEHRQACEKFLAASEHAGPSDPVLTREALLLRAWCIATEIVTEVENAVDVDLEVVQRRMDHLTNEGAVAYEEAGHNFGDLRLAGTENAYLQELTNRTERVTTYAKDGLAMLRRRFAMKDPQCQEVCGDSMQATAPETNLATNAKRPTAIRGIRT